MLSSVLAKLAMGVLRLSNRVTAHFPSVGVEGCVFRLAYLPAVAAAPPRVRRVSCQQPQTSSVAAETAAVYEDAHACIVLMVFVKCRDMRSRTLLEAAGFDGQRIGAVPCAGTPGR